MSHPQGSQGSAKCQHDGSMASVQLQSSFKTRPGGWLPSDPRHTANWIRKLKYAAAKQPRKELVPPIQEFRDMVHGDPLLHKTVQLMFSEAYLKEKFTPLGWQPEVKDFAEFLQLLNVIMTTAPECCVTTTSRSANDLQPAGLIGFPINALLDWPMATSAGYSVFANALVNQQFKKILNYWAVYLVKPESRYVLIQNNPEEHTIAWLSLTAKGWITDAVNSAKGEENVGPFGSFEQVFQTDPKDPLYEGFKSWDDFFVRKFKEGVRPVSLPSDDNVIVNACESAPYALARNVALSDQFWLKEQPYSLLNMLNWDEYSAQFAGGTVYQAFLTALSYHRWHSPVNGTVRKAYVVNGTYYLENEYQGFMDDQPDAAGPNNSQGFLTAVATRALIFIEADCAAIGLMCFVAVGMAEVSSCEITVKPGDRVKKGDQLGMFHFGGSSHCLCFRPDVNLTFELYGQTPGPEADTIIRVNTTIAHVA